MKDKYVSDIIAAVKLSNPATANTIITKDTKFNEIPNMDSMSIVNFQTELADIIGDRANDALPVPEMTLGEYAELLANG